MNNCVDVIVVGAGPGGTSAAYCLTQRGYSVLILEKKALPRYKTCAGGVPISALELFPFQFNGIIEQHIHWSTFVYNHQWVTQQLPPKSMVMVMRDSFDTFLAQRSGAEVIEKCQVRNVIQDQRSVRVITENGHTFRSKYVIGADGVNSRVARSLGNNNRMSGIALEAEAAVSDDLLHHFHGHFLVGLGVLPNGYYWIFPKSQHVSVGIGSMQRGIKSLASLLKESIREHHISLRDTEIRAHPLPIYSPQRIIHKKRVILTGDAAGLVDPLTGEGIRHALKSGILAAEAIASGQLDQYSVQIKKDMGNNFLWSKRLSMLFYSSQYLSFHLLIRNKYIFQDMMKILNHQNTYRRSVFRLPLYLLAYSKRVQIT
jgi:geranylgeranyl reductase family protein